MKREIALVGEFHETFDVPRREPGDFSINAAQHTEITLRANLIGEEGTELAEALEASDVVEIADGVADWMYVMAGTAVQLGTVFTDAEENSAMSDVVRKCVEDQVEMLSRATYARTDEARQMHAFRYKQLQVLGEVLCLGIAAKFGFDYDRVFDEVHRSNMSKANPDGTVTRRESDGKIIKPDTYSPADLSFVDCEDEAPGPYHR